jgi:hypothetical protein
MKSNLTSTASALVLALALTGCSTAMKQTLGLEASPPDAFQVATVAPLSLPPELGVLPQPVPGEPRPQADDAAQSGADTLVPASALTPAPSTQSAGEQALLGQAGPAPSGDIRAEVNQNAEANGQSGIVSHLLGNTPSQPPVVNASAEQKRLQQNEALGQPVTNGATPQEAPPEGPNFFQKIANFF